jgi:acyl carrier protein
MLKEQLVVMVKNLMGSKEDFRSSAHFKNDLGMTSLHLIELTTMIHARFNVDLGRISAEKKIMPESIDDIVFLLEGA